MRSELNMLKTAALCGVSLAALGTAATFFSATSATAQEVALPGIVVISTRPQIGTGHEDGLPGTAVEDPESQSRPPSVGDAGEFLRHVTGVNAGRMGGHGLEPTIHGLDQNQISITNDGAFHFGGCPNRMDPPTSHMQLYTFDKVTVKKGYQTVLDGPPAPGGTIAFERVNPTFTKGDEIETHVKAGAGYNSNGSGKESFADISMGNSQGFVRAFGSYASADNYEDGDGVEIRSAFEQYGGGIILGRTFDADSWITFKVENNNVDDALFPGAGMDAPKTEDWTYQFKGETDLDWGAIRGVKGEVYLTTVDHVMNNFDLRTNTGMMNMEARTESDTLGGKLVFNSMVSGIAIDFGADYRDVMRDGRRYSGPKTDYDPQMVQSVLWPDTSIKEFGLFSEAKIPVSATTKVTAGMRYSLVHASADAVNEVAGGPGGMLSPNDLYLRYYGVTAEDQTENNVSGLLRVEEDLGGGLMLFGALSRAVRTADATERYNAAKGSTFWVGNPEIDPEKHNMIDLGVTYRTPRFNIKGTVYYDVVQDFIQLDSARGQRGVLVYNPAHTVYTNIDAVVAGADAEAEVRLTDYWRVKLGAAYTYGENRSDHIPLAQIAPFSGRLELTYDNKTWMAGMRINAAAEQDRVDSDNTTGSGRDFGPTDAYLTLDLFGAYNITENFQITAGVTNLFDETYANHLNRTNLLDPRGVRVNEPGRSFYVRTTTQF